MHCYQLGLSISCQECSVKDHHHLRNFPNDVTIAFDQSEGFFLLLFIDRTHSSIVAKCQAAEPWSKVIVVINAITMFLATVVIASPNDAFSIPTPSISYLSWQCTHVLHPQSWAILQAGRALGLSGRMDASRLSAR